MFARSETPQQQSIKYQLKRLKAQVETKALQVAEPSERVYLDALADVLGKTDEHAATFFAEIPSFRIEGILQSMVNNYGLVHLDHELRHSFLTGLKKNAVLSLDAIVRFYQGSVRRHEMSCLYTIFLYSDRLYRYDNRGPHNPILVAIDPAPPDPPVSLSPETEGQKKERLAAYQQSYQTLKARLAGLSKDRIHLATQSDRECMELLRLPDVNKDHRFCHPSIGMVVALLPHFVSLVEGIVSDYRQAKKRMVGNAARGALLIIGGLAAQAAFVCLTHYLLGVTIPMAKVMVVMKLTLILGAAFLVLGLSAALYYWYQERCYQYLVQDIAHVNYSKTYPSAPGQNGQRLFTVNKSLTAFFHDHAAILATAFPSP